MSKDFQEELVSYVFSRMVGTHENDKLVNAQVVDPSKTFILGCLAAKRTDKDDDDSPTSQDHERASIRARRMRVSILVSDEEIKKSGQISFTASGNVFYKVNLNDVDSKAWKQVGFSFSGSFSLKDFVDNGWLFENDLDFSELIDQVNQDPKVDIKLPNETWKASFDLSAKPFSTDATGRRLKILRFNFTNTASEWPKRGKKFEHTLFNCKLEVDIGDIPMIEFRDEYDYEGYQQKYYYDFRTINCQAFWLNEEKTRFSTRHYDVFQQPNIKPVEQLEGIDVSFSTLSKDGFIGELERVLNAMRERGVEYSSMISLPITSDFQPRDGNREVSWAERRANIEHFKEITNLFEHGIEILRDDENTRISFMKMNEAFNRYYLSRDIYDASWHLFQIVFIVVGLRSIVKKEDLEVVDVLHVGTGGGKSEAYFGLVVLALFFERIQGKEDGVTAIVKFPLRMLSIQQLERLAGIIIFAEEIRKGNIEIFGGKEFSLGYFVGNQTIDFPGTYSELRGKLYKDAEFKDLIQPAPESMIISRCPLCSSVDRGTIRQVDDPQGKRILQICDKDRSHKFFIYLSDRELFRYRPSVIVSTVDKWAALSQQRRARALLGAKGSMCPHGHGFIPSGDQCEDKKEEGICEEIGRTEDTSDGPILSIQDEMHLLREGFGAISSHFEGLIEEIVKENSSGRKLKHITMSATLNGTENQIHELYNKKAIILPGSSPEGYGSSRDFFYIKLPGEKRLIYGLKPNLRDNHYASLRTLRHIYEFLYDAQKRFSENKSQFLTEYGMETDDDAIHEFKKHLIPLTYHLKVQDAEDMDRFSDTVINDYLTSKGYLKGTVLTGGRGLDELKDILNKVGDIVQNYNIDEQIKPSATYSPLFATSVVSHGVDLEELNLMVFQGIPYSTAEYIQALSRVGRKFRGIVLLWFYPNRVRDDSFFRNFRRYHDSLDHEVKPVPINRTARLGTMQTINSMFCAGILQYISEIEGKPLYHKKDIEDVVRSNPILKQSLVNFIRNVYGKPVEINIEEEVEARLRQIALDTDCKENEFFPNILVNSGNHFYKNQSGMRGIQKQLILKPSDRAQINKFQRRD